MLENDRAEDEDEEGDGSILKSSTIKVYVAAVIELYGLQHSSDSNPHPPPCEPALRGLLKSFKRLQDSQDRESYADRGANGLTSGYSNEELLRLNCHLLEGSNKSP